MGGKKNIRENIGNILFVFIGILNAFLGVYYYLAKIYCIDHRLAPFFIVCTVLSSFVFSAAMIIMVWDIHCHFRYEDSRLNLVHYAKRRTYVYSFWFVYMGLQIYFRVGIGTIMRLLYLAAITIVIINFKSSVFLIPEFGGVRIIRSKFTSYEVKRIEVSHDTYIVFYEAENGVVKQEVIKRKQRKEVDIENRIKSLSGWCEVEEIL